MVKENKIIMNKTSEFKTVLFFQIIGWNYDYEFDYVVSCAEDMEEAFLLYFKKDWKSLFEDTSVDCADVCDVGFNGMMVVGENYYGTVRYQMENRQRLAVTFDSKISRDENGEKIKKIREIIG